MVIDVRFSLLKRKPLILVSDGSFKGYIKDLEVNVEKNEIEYFVVKSLSFKLLPMLFKKDIILTKDDIIYYGNDVILVKDTINVMNSLVNEKEN